MTENATKSSFGWLLQNFGVDYSLLDSETQKLVGELGEEGVEKLIEEDENSHRDTDDLVSLAEKLERIEETSRLNKWVGKGARVVKGDSPKDWINQEQIEVGKKIFGD